VIGIAADARIANLKENIPVVYLPFWHDPPGAVFLLIRTSRSLDEFAPLIRRQIWDIDPEAAVPVIEMLDAQVGRSVAPERLESIVLSSFGIAALVLAILGVYGVLAYSVSLRTPEFDICVALGSSKLMLIRLVLLENSDACWWRYLAGFVGIPCSHPRHPEPALRDQPCGPLIDGGKRGHSAGGHLRGCIFASVPCLTD
jgi:hypothetical protein